MLENFRAGAAFRETDEGIDYTTLIDDLLSGQYDQVQRVVALNAVEGWSKDASEDVAAARPIACRRSVICWSSKFRAAFRANGATSPGFAYPRQLHRQVCRSHCRRF